MAATKGSFSERISDTNWFAYCLELEDGKYYVGVAVDVQKRFSIHQRQGKSSSSWCKKFKPIRIVESFDTGVLRLEDAHEFEDKLVLKYMRLHGIENVRGGRFIGPKALKRAQKAIYGIT